MKHLVRNDISRNFELRGKVACAAHADRRLDDATWRNRMVLLVCLIALAASCALFVGVSHSWFTQSTLNSGNKISVVEASGASDSQPASAPDAQDADSQKPGDASSGSSTSIDAEGSDGGSSADGVDSGDASGAGSVTESAGNEYQGASVAFDIVVKATQAAKEQDGFGNDRYDANATLPVTSTADLKTALTQGGSVSLGSDMIIDPEFPADVDPDGAFAQMSVSADTTLDLSGKTIGLDLSVASEELPTTSILIDVRSGTTTLDGDGVVSAEAGYNNSYAIQVNGGSLVINSGSYYGAMSAVQVAKGSCIINGGFFDLAPTIKSAAPSFSSYLINCIDSAYADGTATVEVKGGTFVNFDPSKGPEVGSPSFVADGYKVVSETQSNGEVWYTVVPE